MNKRVWLYWSKCFLLVCLFLASVAYVTPVKAGFADGIRITHDLSDTTKVGASADDSTHEYKVWCTSLNNWAWSAVAWNGTVTLTNDYSVPKRVTISYSITIAGSGSVTVPSGSSNVHKTSGTYTYKTPDDAPLAPNGTIKIYLDAPKSIGASATMVILSIEALDVAAEGTTITFFPVEGGTYKASKDTITASTADVTATEGTDIVTDKVNVSATAKAGYKFVAWTMLPSDAGAGEPYTVLSGEASTTLEVEKSCTVVPVFMPTETPMFMVNKVLYTEWEAAFAAASTTHPVILYSGGTLKPGTYTINVGEKFLIWRNRIVPSEWGLQMPIMKDNSNRTPFQTLKLGADTTINCSGSIWIDAQQFATSLNNPGHVAGQYGLLDLMSESAVLNLNSGSVFYCYGYVSGAGQVNANSGSTVYELFQIEDWRGGNATNDFKDDLKGESFLISQFYIQNIQTQLVLHHNANCIAKMALSAKNLVNEEEIHTSELCIAGQDSDGNTGLYSVDNSNSKVIRSYSTSTDRVTYELYGKVSLNSITIPFEAPIIGSVKINSSDYVLNIPSSFTVHIKENTVAAVPTDVVVNARVKLLPDTEIIVDQNATLTVKQEMILYDLTDWKSGKYSYSSHSYPVTYAYGRTINRSLNGDAKLTVNGTLNVVDGAGVYSTSKTAASASHANSALSGGGTVVYGVTSTSKPSRTAIKELQNINTEVVEVAVSDILAPMAGISTSTSDYSQSMSYGRTYYGHEDNFWYNYKVTSKNGKLGVDSTDNSKFYHYTPEYDSSGAEEPADIVAYYCTGGQYDFKLPTGAYGAKAAAGTTETELTANDSGVYSIPNIQSDVEIRWNVAQTMKAGSGVNDYETLADAVAAYATDDADMIWMRADNEEFAEVKVNQNTVLDLGGKTVTLGKGMAIASGAALSGMDKGSDGYKDSEAGKIVGTINGTVNPVYTKDGRHYVKLAVDGGTGFHRAAVDVTQYQIALSTQEQKAYLTVAGHLKTTAKAAEKLAGIGFKMNTTDEWYTVAAANRKADLEFAFSEEAKQDAYSVIGMLDFDTTTDKPDVSSAAHSIASIKAELRTLTLSDAQAAIVNGLFTT